MTSRRKLPVALILVVVAGLWAPASAQPAPPLNPRVTCAACVVIDDRGRTLWARAARTPLANASTTKMVTAIVVLQHADIAEPVTVSAHAAATGGGGLDLQPGDVVAVGDLLHALLMTSSNDAAVALAEHVAGTEADFVVLMNAYADRVGADGTAFVTSHGLDVPGHVSTARDLARLGLALLRRPLLADIVATGTASIAVGTRTEALENRNLLLDSYEGATGIKTGFTAQAGNVLVASAERNDRRLIAVAMSSDDAFEDAAALLDFGFATLAQTVLLDGDEPVAALVLDPAGVVPVVPAGEIRGMADPRALEIVFDAHPVIELPVHAGDTIGTLTIVAAGDTVGVLDALADADVAAPAPAPAGASLITRLLQLVSGLGEIGR